ncbi:DNA polymerase subunit beta [Candidatus Magnetoovum chiemensis]|nr:DNA polymerase subunit beta [Candidatus Magnetoovum chiemensis]
MSEKEISLLKEAILSVAPDASVYLFGSRADDSKKGGDIDIMVISENKLTWKEKATIRWSYFDKFGQQKLDIISATFNEENAFKNIVLSEGIKL